MHTTENIVPAVTLPEKLRHLVNSPPVGSKAAITEVSVNTPMDDSQRDFNENDVIRYIAKSQCLDWNLFGVVTVVERSDGTQTMINGQHRTSLVKTLRPQEKTVPAHIIKTDDREYAARLFACLNGVTSRNVSREQLLWAEVLARDPEALTLKQHLITAGLACGRVNQGPRPEVKRATFERCVKFGETETQYAVKLITQAYPDAVQFDNLLLGVVRLLSHEEYRTLMRPQLEIGRNFQEWFTKRLPESRNYREATYPELRLGQWYNGIALGLYRQFVRYMDRQGVRHRCPAIDTLKLIYERSRRDIED